MKTCQQITELVKDRKQIETRLHNATLIVNEIAEYRVIYEQLVQIEQLVHERNMEAVVSLLVDNEKRLSVVHDKQSSQSQLFHLLYRVNNRKKHSIQILLSSILKKLVCIDSKSITVHSRAEETSYKSLSLEQLFQLLQSLGNFEQTVCFIHEQLLSFCQTVLSKKVSLKRLLWPM